MIEFDRLGNVWQQQAGDGPARGPAGDLEAARARAERLERMVRRRDMVETVTALLLAVVFAWLAFTTSGTLSRVGAVIVAAAGVFIPIRLWTARRGEPDRSLPIRDAAARELTRIRAQQRLLGTVAWWYLAPLGLGVILFMAGAPVPLVVKVVYAAAVTALCAWILRLNLRAVRRELQPIARDLEAWLASVDDQSCDDGSK